jgi:selenocysteine-specific elongation factor
MIVGTAGHIDHGKTALVRALTGVDTDRLKEEKARGITIDLGFAYLPVANGVSIGFVDVPGHEKFVHTMVAGAGSIDFALLVVAADDGVMPQTREHIAIMDLLGLARGIVALTKVDLVSDERRQNVIAAINDVLAETSLSGSTIATGFGCDRRRRRLAASTAHRGHMRGGSSRFRSAIPSGGRQVLRADRYWHSRYRHGVVWRSRDRRSRHGQPVRHRSACAIHPRAKPRRGSWAGKRSLCA